MKLFYKVEHGSLFVHLDYETHQEQRSVNCYKNADLKCGIHCVAFEPYDSIIELNCCNRIIKLEITYGII